MAASLLSGSRSVARIDGLLGEPPKPIHMLLWIHDAIFRSFIVRLSTFLFNSLCNWRT